MLRSPPRDVRGAERRLGREWSIWWFRFGAACFATIQTAVEPGDSASLSWFVVAVFWGSVVATWRPLRTGAGDGVIRAVGVFSMAIDAAVVALVMANNLTDPAEPVYLVAVLAQLEATIRWPRRGGLVAGVLAGVAAGSWTVAVHDQVGLDPQPSFVTMRTGTIIALGVFLWSVVRRLSEQRDLVQRVLDTSRDMIVVLDADGTILSTNSASEPVLGYAPEEMVGRNYRDFLHPDDRDRGEGILANLASDPVLIQRRFFRADGEIRWLELNIAAGAEGAGLVHVSARDVTGRLEVERRIAESEQRFRSLFEHNSDAVYALDLEGRFISANPVTEQLTGHPVADLMGTEFTALLAEEQRGRSVANFDRAVAGGAQNYDTVIVAREGRRIDVDVTNMPIVVDGEVVGVFGVAKDVTDRRQLERLLGHQATHDQLTGLPNRAHLEQVLTRSLTRTADRARTLLFIDLDRFKHVNDSFGHRAGDEVLVEVVARLREHIRVDDLLARWAGDEFCLLLAERTSEDTALSIAQRILGVISEPFHLGDRTVHLSASIGVARSDDVEDPERFVQIADHAMYEAKRAGRNRVAVYDASADRIGTGRSALEDE